MLKTLRIVLPVTILLLAGCRQYRDVTYLNNLTVQSHDSVYLAVSQLYKVQPADILYISVKSFDEKIAAMFDLKSGPTTSNLWINAAPYIYGFSVSPIGTINLPLVGNIQVAGFTLREIQDTLTMKVKQLVPDALVDVKLLSFKVSILGEVRNPGMFTINNTKANIFEALAMANDITLNGNKSKVIILRATEKGTKSMFVNLTDKSMLSSDNYYLQPNDIIYVKPLRSSVFRTRVTEYSSFLSAITAAVSIYLLFIKL